MPCNDDDDDDGDDSNALGLSAPGFHRTAPQRWRCSLAPETAPAAHWQACRLTVTAGKSITPHPDQDGNCVGGDGKTVVVVPRNPVCQHAGMQAQHASARTEAEAMIAHEII